MEDRAGLRAHDGYVTGFDLRMSSAQGAPLDFEATALVLQAARHYDRDDGGRFARLEEAAAMALLAGSTAGDPTQGTPATLAGTTPSARSGLVTAVTVVRTLVEAEIAARDESNQRGRLKVAGFPVTKTLEEFKMASSSVAQATLDYLASLEGIRAAENLLLVGPPGTGKSHLLVGLGHAAVAAGHRVRYFVAADLVETL